MIRSQEIIDKLIADLHFHNYLNVVSDNIFTNKDESVLQIENCISKIGLSEKLDANTDFYHGGSVANSSQIDYIYQYIDDVFIDYFFRTYKFKEIIFPKGLCYEQITHDGIIHPNNDVVINLNDLCDRCTFTNNISQLFGIHNCQSKIFPKNTFIKQFDIDYDEIFGLHSCCNILENKIPFWKDFDEYLESTYLGDNTIKPQFRGAEIINYSNFLYNESISKKCNRHRPYIGWISSFYQDFSRIKDSHFLGEYSVEDILFIYALLVDKFALHKRAFLLSICHCPEHKIDNKILVDFSEFENQTQDYHVIEPYICSEDLFLRFSSHTRSNAFKFCDINKALCSIQLFNKEAILLLRYGNTMPLPYLYNKLNK